jgi:hypothetical protein
MVKKEMIFQLKEKKVYKEGPSIINEKVIS